MDRRWYFAAAALAIIAAVYFGLANSRAPMSTTRLSVHFIDVGEGDSILIATGHGRAVLVDGGTDSEGQTVCDYLRGQQIGHLDAVILTHPHADHVGGLIRVLDRFPVDRVYDASQERGPRVYRHFRREVERRQVPLEDVQEGTSINLESDIEIEFLGPPDPRMKGTNADTENNSVVLRLTCGGISYLLAGDLQREGETNLLASEYPLRAQVLKVGHHGGIDALSDELLKAVSPKWAVISVGEGNEFDYPAPETLRRLMEAGVRVLRTDLNGSVVLSTDGKTIRESVEKAP